LGPGLANGLANLHNAKKARSGIVNIVGEHTTSHRNIDAPLSADVEGGWFGADEDADRDANHCAALKVRYSKLS
jgi:hypothetical protein